MACCPTTIGPVSSDYKPTGETIKQNGLEIYVKKGGPKAIIVFYDIFGMHPNTYQDCDKIAESTGFTVVMPDFFKSEKWPADKPPKERPEIIAWVKGGGGWEVAQPYLEDTVLPYLKGNDVTSVGLLGFCWGGKMGFLASGAGLVKAVASAHPSFITAEEAKVLTGPTCIIPSKDEPPMEDIQEVLSNNQFKDVNIWNRFEDMHHGFCSARGDLTVPEQAARVTEALNIFAKWFSEQL
eukprot:TRINITY_DN8635_c0_g1_i1.p1 TRINITY_DN8635_c0_g1~~TRINITY_DN8635_c0_g1_i1.p1  ORF type:complete len:238 (-),score=38.80 TRINITY_DN8635_c0_g1_i1:120-833(-)